jgi:hypothetical protein
LNGGFAQEVDVDQTVINWLWIACSAAFGWLLKVIWDAITELKTDMKQIERDLPEIYVRKDDFRSALSDVKVDMKEIRIDMKEGFNKLDNTLKRFAERREVRPNQE